MDTSTPLILYVDPNPACSRLMKTIIEQRQWRYQRSQFALDAIFHAARIQPDIILTEMNLGHTSGLDLLRSIKTVKQTEHIPLLAVSANVHQETIDTALSIGFEGYIAKPFNLETLYDSIENIIERHSKNTHLMPC